MKRIANLFILHGMVIDDMKVGDASSESRKLIKENWKDYLKENILFNLAISCMIAVVGVVCLFLPLKIIELLPLPGAVSRSLALFIGEHGRTRVSCDNFWAPTLSHLSILFLTSTHRSKSVF